MVRVPTTSRLAEQVVASATAVALMSSGSFQASWQSAHGTRANTGFVNVTTARAGRGSVSVPGLGTFAPGAGPVVALDGTVYLGTLGGKVIALRADGRPFWQRDITPGQAIVASPAIDSEGSVYVTGVRHRTIRDHRDGKTTTRTVFEATLHKFTSSGGWVAQTPFPVHANTTAATSAPPNIVRAGAQEFIVVPAVYNTPPIQRTRLVTFSTAGAVVADPVVASATGTAIGGGGIRWPALCLVPVAGQIYCLGCSGGRCDFTPPTTPSALPPPPMPGAAVFTFPGGNTPFVIVSNQLHEVVGFTMSGVTFTERFRVREEKHRLSSPPMTLPDGHTLVGTANGAVVFAGPNGDKLPPVVNLGRVHAAPTMTADGRAVVLQSNGKITVLQNGVVVANTSVPGETIVSAAASRTHVFVSTTEGFYTLDPSTMSVVSTFDWVGGGVSPPAIGPNGHVYALASNILFVFPPPQ
jgi:outer membrane protein assembly factor BamB